MALQVWLPLNGTLKNKGLSDLSFSIISSNTSTSSQGIVGSCYGNDSNTAGGLISNKTISLGQNQSMFCWMKFTSLYSSAELGGTMVSQHRYPNNTGMGITIKYISSTTGYLSVNTGNGSSRTYNTYCGTTLLQANTWYHVGYTYDGVYIRLYVNGNCEGKYLYTDMSVPADYITCFVWSFANTSGATTYGGYKLNGYLNDVRVYDHTLSDKEVHFLAQGLVSYYPLDKDDNNIEKDKSGYESNATKQGNFSYAYNTLQNTISTKFTRGSTVIGRNTKDLVGNTNGTLAAWVYLLDHHSERDAILINNGQYLTINASGYLSAYAYGKSPEGYHDSNSTVPLNKWTHIALVWDSNNLYMYINGKLDKTISCTGSFSGNTNVMWIGGEYYTNTTRGVNGYISDVRTYATAFNAQEIWDLYTMGEYA